MKKLTIYLIMFFLFCTGLEYGINYTIGKQIEHQSPYQLSFASIGANLLEFRFDSWAKIKTVKTYNEMEQFLLNKLVYLGLNGDINQFNHYENDDQLLITYCMKENKDELFFTIISDRLEMKSYMMVNVISTGNDDRIRAIEEKLAKKLDCTTYYQYTGTIDKISSYEDREKLIQVVFKTLDSKPSNIYKDGKIISMVGLSPKVPKNLRAHDVEGGEYNMQAVIKANYQQNKTYIYLGFPLLLDNY